MHTTPDGYGSREADWLSPAAMAKRVRLAIDVAAERVPLARANDDRVRDLGEGAKAELMHGAPCAIDMSSLERMVGPVSAETLAAAGGLSARERAALLLASPEFMRR
jgi:uncharacterized protein (DUF1800 family)